MNNIEAKFQYIILNLCFPYNYSLFCISFVHIREYQIICWKQPKKSHILTAAWLAQLGERRSTEREVAGSNPGRTNTQGL